MRMSLAVTGLLSSLVVPICHAQTVSQISTSVSTDRLYHGVTESTENPSVNLRAELHQARWFAGSVLEYANEDSEIERHRSLTTYIGVDHQFRDSGWAVSGTSLFRKFIESNKEWDYWEFSTQVRTPSGFDFTVDYAPDYYAHNRKAIVSQVSRFHEFGSRQYLLGIVGYNALERADDYFFGTVATGWMLGQTSAEIAFDWHNIDQDHRFGDEIQSNRLRLTLSHRIY